MKFAAKKILGYFLPVVFMVVLLYFTFYDIDIDIVFEKISEVSFFWLVVFLFTFFFSHFIRAYRWKVLIEPVKENTSVKNLFSATMFGYGLNTFVPRLGEIYRPVVLGKLEGISRSSMFGTIVVERVVDIIALGISVLLSVHLYSGNIYDQVPWLKDALFYGLLIIASIIIIIFLLVYFKNKSAEFLFKIISKISKRFAEKVHEVFDTMVVGFSTIKTFKRFLYVMLLTVVIMIVYGLSSYIGLLLLNMNDYQPVNLEMGWVLMSLSAFGIIIPTPGGTGSFHLITVSILVNLYNFSAELSGAFAILTHFISVVSFTVSLFVVYFFVIKKRTDKSGQNLTLINMLKI